MFCTYCAELNCSKTFKAKSDWKKHEMRMHETGEDWPCPVNGCSRVHDRQKDFIKHHGRYHSGRPLPSVTDIGIRLLPRKVFGCGFDKCKEVSIGWDERCDHVAKHMKNGSTMDQWKYSNVIRNLVRQEALHDTWKELFANLDDRLKESRSQITWSPDNTRTLRQKLQCCDLRPNREEVLITAISLRSDISLDPSQIHFPIGFITPSRDSVPNLEQLSREQRMHILNGNPNIPVSRSRLASLNAALLQVCPASAVSEFNFMPESPVIEEPSRRISYMDVDTSGDFLPIAEAAIPPVPQELEQHQSHMEQEQPSNDGFVDPGKPSNPLNWCYPNYFDAPPQFEESQYYDRPSISRMFSRPLHKLGSRLGSGSRNSSPHSRPASQTDQPDFGSDFALQMPMQQQQQQQQPQPQPQAYQQHHYAQPPQVPQLQQPHPMAMRPPYRPDQHEQLHLFTTANR